VNKHLQRDRVIYFAHGGPNVIPADDLPHVETIDGIPRVVAYVGVGSHATLPGPNTPSARDEWLPLPQHQAEWQTWQNLQSAPSQTLWYAFGGAWGRVKLPPLGVLPEQNVKGIDVWSSSAGPLGPGPLKLKTQELAITAVDDRAGRAPRPTEAVFWGPS
jgi:hypothetical protein